MPCVPTALDRDLYGTAAVRLDRRDCGGLELGELLDEFRDDIRVLGREVSVLARIGSHVEEALRRRRARSGKGGACAAGRAAAAGREGLSVQRSRRPWNRAGRSGCAQMHEASANKR